METVEDKHVTLAYKLYSIENGEKESTEEAPAEHPFQFISGLGPTLEAFESQVKNLKRGNKFDFIIKVEEAYGKCDEEHVIDLPKNIFEVEGKFSSGHVVEGVMIPLMTSGDQRISGSVVEVKDSAVVMDMNHLLAGRDPNFVDEVVEDHPATNDELAEMACMMGGDGCGGGCNGGCDYGDCSDEYCK